MARAQDLRIWVTVHVHRHAEPIIEDMPACLAPVADLFEVVIILREEGEKISVKPLAARSGATKTLFLDPATMLIKPAGLTAP